VHADDGSPVEWTPEAIAPLLARWDERVRSEVSRFQGLPREVAEHGSVLCEPATEEQVRASEERLGLRLPDSYRAFLLVSNGAHASTLGAEQGAARHGFLSVEEIAPAAEADSSYVDIWTEDEVMLNPENDNPPPPGKGVDVRNFAPIRDALLISRPHEAFRDMLVPREGKSEWELWACAKEGSIAYRSFADFLLASVSVPRFGPEPSLADDYVAQVHSGQRWALRALAEIDDPRTGELAVELLRQEDPPSAWPGTDLMWERERALTAAHVLGLLADPQFIPELRSALGRAQGMDMRRSTLIALAACGAPDAFDLLCDAATNDTHDEVRFAAVTSLPELDDPRASDVLQRVAATDSIAKVRKRAREMLENH
jgi:hypothetical protein